MIIKWPNMRWRFIAIVSRPHWL